MPLWGAFREVCNAVYNAEDVSAELRRAYRAIPADVRRYWGAEDRPNRHRDGKGHVLKPLAVRRDAAQAQLDYYWANRLEVLAARPPHPYQQKPVLECRGLPHTRVCHAAEHRYPCSKGIAEFAQAMDITPRWARIILAKQPPQTS